MIANTVSQKAIEPQKKLAVLDPLERPAAPDRIILKYQQEEEFMAEPKRVLIAEPNAALLTEYGKSLQQEGYVVATATTALECLARLRDFLPDVLVLEPRLPWGWGEGVLAILSEESDIPRVKVIVVSAGPHEGLAQAGEYPISVQLRKPLPPQSLAQEIRQVLEDA